MKTLANDSDLNELRERYAALGGDEQPLFGAMSAATAVCHVRQAYSWALSGQSGTLPFKLPLPQAMIKKAALSLPMKWRPGLKTICELEPGQPGTVPAEFADDKAGLLTEMNRFCKSIGRSSELPAHAFFGPMTRADWLRWGYLHADHHLRQFGC